MGAERLPQEGGGGGRGHELGAGLAASARPQASGLARCNGERERERGAGAGWGWAGVGATSVCSPPQGSSSWEAADLGNEERKQKFLRLMGAAKVRPAKNK